ncbi:hypothetical protein PINS_up008229 [Pythium insidiosum]|nr:hypothetical protein PINS_up008229 [Pythium insidiosum]
MTATPMRPFPYRIANSLMFARTSAVSNTCELLELTEKDIAIPDLLRSINKKTVEYEKTIGVDTVSKALEALVLRVYERSKNMSAGGHKPSGHSFSIHSPTAASTEPKDGCC